MSPELRDDLEIAVRQFDELRAGGKSGAAAFLAAVRTYRALSEKRHPTWREAPEWAHLFVAEYAVRHGWKPVHLLKSRIQAAVRLRDEIAFELHVTGLATPAIGDALGGKDHSSIVTALQRFRERLAQDELLRARMEKGQESAA